MRLAEFLGALEVAGLEFQSEDILDALWLASRNRKISLYASSAGPIRLEGDATEPADRRSKRKAKPKSSRRKASTREILEGGRAAGGTSRVFAGGLPSATDRTVKAAPVAIPAGQALPNRLALARSLRPLCRRWPSRRDLEIDEEKTAEVSAEVDSGLSSAISPVFRPGQRRWYDVHVVLEDDPVIELWNETIRDFCQLLRDTGGFRTVQSWRLRVQRAEEIESEASPSITIETPSGARLPTGILVGTGTRRLIFFVTHGSSPLWRDGTYTHILEPWLREASVALLHMLPRGRWQHTHLGDVNGLCSTEEPGPASAQLKVEPFWWQRPDDLTPLLKIPATSLDVTAMNDWALMQMARGRRSPVFLLDARAQLDSAAISRRPASKRDFERAIAQLRQVSPEAFLLGIYLSPSYFTIPVARLIQEAKFGTAANPSQLGELFLSGLVFAKAEMGNSSSSSDERYFAFWPQAREILMQSLREEDARSIAAELENRVSRFIEETSGRSVTFRGLVPRADGAYDLPEFAQSFARVANSLFGLLDDRESTASSVPPLPQKPPVPKKSRISQSVSLASARRARANTLYATVRMYRQGLGDCFLLSLKGQPQDYTILVDCGVIIGTPNAAAIMSKVATDILNETSGKIDALIVTQSYWTKVSGFAQAASTFSKLSVGTVMVGWWENPSDALARKLRRRSGAPSIATQSGRALEFAKHLGKALRFLDTWSLITLGNTGARLYFLGASRDQRLKRVTPMGQVPGLDFAIELANREVLLFATNSNPLIWPSFQQLSWSLGDRSVTGSDLLKRTVFCRTRLMGSSVEVFQYRAMPLMPNLRIVAAPLDRTVAQQKRWAVPSFQGIQRSLPAREGCILVSDENPKRPPRNVRIGDLWFDAVF